MLTLILENYQAILSGFKITLFIFFTTVIFWILCWVLFAYISINNKRVKTIIDLVYIIFISIPVIVLLFWFHYPLQIILNITISPIITTIVTLSIINILGIYKIIYKKIKYIKEKYSNFSSIIGINTKNIRKKIEYPLLFRKSIDEVLSYQINILHMTLFASLISVNDIFRVAHQINASTYKSIEIYTLIGIIFLLISLSINLLIIYLKKKYNYDYSG